MATTEKGSPELGFPRQESASCRAFCSCRVRCGPIRRPDGRMRLGAPTSSPLPLRSPRKPRPTRWLQAAEHGPTRHPHPLLRGVDHDGSVRCRHSAGAVRRLRRGVEEDRRIEPGPPPGRPPRRPYGVGLTPTMPRLGRQVVTVTRELGRSLGLGRHRWTGREQVAESRTPPMSAGGLDNFLGPTRRKMSMGWNSTAPPASTARSIRSATGTPSTPRPPGACSSTLTPWGGSPSPDTATRLVRDYPGSAVSWTVADPPTLA